MFARNLTPEIKRDHWGDGPWVSEPDHFEFEHEGFNCFILRMAFWQEKEGDYLSLGQWNGYVVIPEDHPWYKLDIYGENIPEINVHGGITFSDFEPIGWGEPKIFAVGFDCSHSYDITPSMKALYRTVENDCLTNLPASLRAIVKNSPLFDREYRTYEYAIEQTKHLANQAKLAIKN